MLDAGPQPVGVQAVSVDLAVRGPFSVEAYAAGWDASPSDQGGVHHRGMLVRLRVPRLRRCAHVLAFNPVNNSVADQAIPTARTRMISPASCDHVAGEIPADENMA